MMELTNELQHLRDAGVADADAWNEAVRLLVLMLAPPCPHIAEELWQRTGGTYSVHQQEWPEVDQAATVRDTVDVVVQVNGKVREHIAVAPDADEAAARAHAEAAPRIAEQLAGKEIARVVYVPGRLLNFVVK